MQPTSDLYRQQAAAITAVDGNVPIDPVRVYDKVAIRNRKERRKAARQARRANR